MNLGKLISFSLYLLNLLKGRYYCLHKGMKIKNKVHNFLAQNLAGEGGLLRFTSFNMCKKMQNVQHLNGTFSFGPFF